MKKSALTILFSSISLVTSVTDSALACDISSISSMSSRDSFSLDDGVDWQAKFRELENWWQNVPKQPLAIPEWQIKAAEQEKEEKRQRQEMLEAKLRSNASNVRFQQQSDDLLAEVRERNGKTGQFVAFNSNNIHKLKKEKPRKKQQYVPDYATYQKAKQALENKALDQKQRARHKKIIEAYNKFWQEVEFACEASGDDGLIYEVDSETQRANAEFAEFVRQYESGEYNTNINADNKGCGVDECSNNADRLSALASQIHKDGLQANTPKWQGLDFADGDDLFGYLFNELAKDDSKEVFIEAANKARIRANKKTLKDLSKAAQEAAIKRVQQKERFASLLAELRHKVAKDERLKAAKQACEEMLKGRRITIEQKENMLLLLQELLAFKESYQESRQESGEEGAETNQSSFWHEYSTSSAAEESGDNLTANVNAENISSVSEYILEPDIGQFMEPEDKEGHSSNLPDLMAIKQKTGLLFENSLLHNIMVSHRLLQLVSPAAGDEERIYGFWLSGMVSKARQQPSGDKGYTANSRNITIGVDGELPNGHLLGFAASVGNSKLNITNGSNYYKVVGLSGAFYHHAPISWQAVGGFQLESQIFASYSWLNTLSVNSKGKMSSYAAGVRTSAAKNIAIYQGKKVQLHLTPSLQAGYDYLHTGKFQELSDDGYHAQVAANSAHRLQAAIEVKMQGNIAANCGNSIRPEISVQLTKYHYSKPVSIKGFAEYQGERIEQVIKGIGAEQKTILAIGGGIEFGMGDGSFGAHYNCNIAKGYLAHQASLRLRVEI